MLHQQPDFIFSNKAQHRISRHVVFWMFCVLFFTLLYGSKPIDNLTFFVKGLPQKELLIRSYELAFMEALSFLPTHIILSYTFMYLLIPRYLFKGKYLYFFLGLTFAVLLVATLSNAISDFIVIPIREAIGVIHPVSNFYYGLMSGVRGGLTVAGFAGAIKLAKHWYQKNQLNLKLEHEKLTAELQLLKAQVHPHFLFNTLNNLYSLTLTHSAEAPEVVLKLSGLLRYMLYEGNVPKVPLSKEVKLITDYLELEKMRYGNRLDLSVNLSGDFDGKLIAPLLLLPFLENSFKHGASEHLDQAWVSLDLSVRENKLKLKLMNALPEASALTAGGVRSGGIGLQNVQKRLQLIYPDQHELKIIREAEVFIVTLVLYLEPDTMFTHAPAPDYEITLPPFSNS
ncbi:sensor histidine kinase [Pontibacter sp. SGAir0037]|uniref:sensor histidine kinase n=1 Tax=Pontibacter sp. SGAir0037 TaxID=2571030 RepID=UPI0019801BBA|nr:histidine kinase [Pontibacter sp. SGAir0037]